MKIIVPMAGMGKRMRPHSLTVPKPLIPVAGKPIVQHLLENIFSVCEEPIDEVAFVIGRFGEAVEKQLLAIAKELGSVGSIHYQDEALGTAHAILCAKDRLTDKTIVAFADTIFKADFNLDAEKDGIIWVHKVEDPRPFGVVKTNEEGVITEFVEKPQEFVSDMAIIGIYYFKDGPYLRRELEYLIDNDLKDKGEFQLTNALENMKSKGTLFFPGKVDEWLDCGNKNATVFTNQRVLEIMPGVANDGEYAKDDSVVICPPCYIGKDVVLKNAVIGPHVSIGNNSHVENVVVSNTIVQNNSVIKNRVIRNSMIGNFVQYEGEPVEVSIGDYCEL